MMGYYLVMNNFNKLAFHKQFQNLDLKIILDKKYLCNNTPAAERFDNFSKVVKSEF